MKAIVFFLTFLGLIGCSSKKSISKSEEKFEYEKFIAPDLYSKININYKIRKKTITDTFNFVIDEITKTPFEFPEYNVTTKLKRNGNIIAEFVGKDVLVKLPLDVEVIKKTIIKDLKANGSMEMNFISNLNIAKDWTFTTKTQMADYKWTKTPSLGIGVINLPIETISNLILKKIKGDIESSVDQSIKEAYDLRAIIQEVANMSFLPFEMDSVFGGWMQMSCDSAFMSPTFNTKEYTEGKISLKTKMNLTSQKPQNTAFNVKIPNFAWDDKLKDSSRFKLLMEIDYDHLTRVARKNFVGQTFTDGDRSIQVLDVRVDKKDGKLQVSTDVKGSFNGTLSVMGKPAFNKTKGNLYAENIDINVKTGNVLYSAAAWLLKGKIKSKLDEMMQFPLNENIKNLQEQVDEQVKELNKKYKMELNVKLGSLDIENIILRPDRANAYVVINLKLSTVLNNLYMFQD